MAETTPKDTEGKWSEKVLYNQYNQTSWEDKTKIALLQEEIEVQPPKYDLETYKNNAFIIKLFGTEKQLIDAYTKKYPEETTVAIRERAQTHLQESKTNIATALDVLEGALNRLVGNASFYAAYGNSIDAVELISIMLQETSMHPRQGNGDEEWYFQLVPASSGWGLENPTTKADSVLASHGVTYENAQGKSSNIELAMKGITYFLYNKQKTLSIVDGYGSGLSLTPTQKLQLCYFTYNKWRGRLKNIIDHLKWSYKQVTFAHIKQYLFNQTKIDPAVGASEQFSQFFNDPYTQYGLNRDVSTKDTISELTPYQACVGLNYMIHVDALKKGVASGKAIGLTATSTTSVTKKAAWGASEWAVRAWNKQTEAIETIDVAWVKLKKSPYETTFSMISAVYGKQLQARSKTVNDMIKVLKEKRNVTFDYKGDIYMPATPTDQTTLRNRFLWSSKK